MESESLAFITGIGLGVVAMALITLVASYEKDPDITCKAATYTTDGTALLCQTDSEKRVRIIHLPAKKIQPK
jgi:hypothetical protein